MSSNADNDNNPVNAGSEAPEAAPVKVLNDAAKRALAEAEERRRNEQQATPATEIGGRGGADPARFGDWEINGRAIDF